MCVYLFILLFVYYTTTEVVGVVWDQKFIYHTQTHNHVSINICALFLTACSNTNTYISPNTISIGNHYNPTTATSQESTCNTTLEAPE